MIITHVMSSDRLYILSHWPKSRQGWGVPTIAECVRIESPA